MSATMTPPQAVTIPVDDSRQVSGLLQAPRQAAACYVLAHGAGSGMTHPFIAEVASGLAGRRIATLRYQFPYMERGSKRPDAPKLAQTTVRAAVAEASRLLPGLTMVAGGKSYGGRMTSQAHTEKPIPGIRGLVFLGFPLHPPDRPSNERAEHLFEAEIPMLFVQGSRDALADIRLMRRVVQRLGPRATLKVLEEADHSFHVPVRSGRTDPEIRSEMFDAIAGWLERLGQGVCSRG
jgi:predicted alpha/beta-hydrolase family hydrolase